MSRAWLWLGLLLAFTGSAKELVLVDADLATQIQAKPGVEFRRLNGLDDLPNALAGDRWSRVSLISHGQSGALQLGGERLDLAFLAQHPGFLNAWRQQLTTNAQLELWGCAVAKDQGHQLVDSLSTSIGRPVLASTDATGPSRLGGNLSLEYGHGRVPDRTPLAGLQQLLVADLTVANSEGFDSCENCVDNTAYSAATVFGSFKVSSFTGVNKDIPNNSLAVAPAGGFSPTQSLLVIANNPGDVTMIRVASSGGSGDVGNGGHFRLKSLNLKGNYTGGYSTDVLIHAFRNGTEIGTGTPLDLLTPKVFDLSSNANFYDIDAFTITGPDLVIWMDDIMVDAPLILKDSDGTLIVGVGTEPTSIATSAGTTAALDFTLTDGGTSDSLAMAVSQVKVHVSGTSTDDERGYVTWTLTGPDITGSATGVYDGATDIVTFNQAISIANGGNETYTVKVDLGHNGLIEGHTFILSLDGDTDLTLGSGGTRMASTSAVNNGSGFATSVTASQLAFTAQPAGSISGSALTTQPVVAAQDSYGNTDVGFTGDISLSEASAGTLSGTSTVAASSGVATFTNLLYTASADQEAFTLGADASGLTGATANSVTSNVVATKLLFNIQPAPTSLSSGSSTNFTTVPVLKAVDANNTVDTGYNTNMVLSVSNTSGGAVAGTVNSLTTTGDTDGSATTVTLIPASGSATFSGLGLNYTNAGISDSLALRATSGTLNAAISSTLTSLALPTVTDAHISISGASGTGGAFKVGDTVTATWNNTSGGDNNSGISAVTVDFSQYGGGVAVTASNSGETWSATYIITSGSIDATSRNISVSATNVNGTGTTADGSNATVDNQTPTVSDARISLSGSSGTGGAFKAGDTVTATWNNTASGDNNGDISAVSVDFSAFGGGSAVVASNSGGTWTATYTLVAGTIADTNRNVSVTATDNAGNTTTTADTTNASVDSQTPAVTDARISISGASGTGGAFKIGDTVTATWNNTASGDNNGDISSVSVDFSGFGGGSAVAASNSAGTWTVTYLLTAGAIDASNRNVSITVTDNAGNTTTTADTSNATVDNVAPTVTDAWISISGATGIGGIFKVGDTVTATWNNTASGDNNGDISAVTVDFSAFDGGSAVTASNSGGTWTAIHALGAGVANGSNRNVSVTVSDNAGNSNTSADTSNGIVDTTAPTVTTVAVPANGTYTTGQSLDFTVNFDEAVTVIGTPRLALTLGSSTVYASYVGGSGSSALTFRHAVQAGENDSDGLAVGALGLNSGTIKDVVGNDATLTLNSVASTSSVLVDTTAPTVTTVAVPANGTYTTGQSLDFTVNFDEAVTVTGTPRLALTLGSSSEYASYVSGSGSSVLTFRHAVQAGENDADGIAVGVLGLHSGIIKDAAGNDATLTLNSVGNTSGVLVDTSAPTVNSVAVPANGTYITGQDLDFTVNFSEVVTVTGTPQLALTLGSSTVYADYLSGGGSSVLTFRHAVQTGENDADGIAVGALGLNSGILKDAAGNDASLTLNSVASTSGVLVDTSAPTVNSVAVPANGTYTTGQNLDFTVNFDEAVTVDTSGGTPRLVLTLGSSTVYADYLSGSGSSVLTFRHAVQAGENDADGIAVGALGLNSGTIKDAAGNDATLTLSGVGSTSSVLVDTTAPTVTTVAVPANGTYTTGQNLDFTVNFDEAVTVDTSGGTPRLVLTLGSSTVYADYLSGSGSSALTFRHAVQAGENDADGIAVGALGLNSGTIKDAAGNDATLTLNSVGNTSGVLVDTSAPVVSSVAVPVNDTYISGENLAFSVNFSKAVTVDSSGGMPYLALTVGSSTVQASYASGSGSTALIFSYPIQAGDQDSDGIAVRALSANGGTLKDGVGNNATLALNNVASTSAVLVDGIAPTLSSSSPADGSTSVAFDANVQLVLSEAITAGSGNIAIYDAADDSLVEANAVGSSRVTLSGNTLTLDPLANLIPSHSYYLQIGAQALLDAAGNAYAGISDKTTLNFTVANVAPVAQADNASTQEDSAVQVDVTANDSDVDSALNKASVTVVTAAQHGATSVDTGTGVITYTPAANYNGNDSFSYRVQDIYGANSNTVTVGVTVQAVNDAPQAVADIGSTSEDASLTLDVLANDSDIDSGDSLDPTTLSLVTSPAHGAALISNGQVTYTPAANFNGSDGFSYTVADQHGAVSNVAIVMINVGSSNDAPVAANDIASTDEDHAVTVNVLSNDSDLDGTLMPASVTLLQQPAHGQLMLDVAIGALIYTPAANYFGQDTFSYAVMDNEGATSNAASVTVTVNSINDAPVATNNSVTLQEDASLSINVLGNDSDVDGTLAPASVQLVSQPAHGTATVSNTNGSVLYTPTSNAVGDDSFSYRVQDDQGAWSNVATVTMTIQSVNDAPLANADQGDLDEDSALTLHLLDNDSDIDGSLQDVRIIARPASGSLNVGSSGEVTYTPAANFHGSDVFSYQAVDNEGALSPSVVVTLTVRAVNDVPTITGNGAATLLEGTSYHFAPVINDVDGDALTVTASGLPQWLSINSRTGELSGTPVVGQAGQYDNIVLTVSDGTAQSALPAFALTVQADLDGDGLANSVDADDDNDGMSDGYEDDHDFNPLDPTDATTDADQDGVSNQQESVDGTNPQDANDYLDTTAPVVSAVADVTVDATGRFTSITVRKLLGLADTVSDDEVATALRALSSDNIDGAACCSVTIDDMSDNQLLLAPGRHEVVYQATDRKGNVGTVIQLVRVRPLVSMSKDQVAVPGQSLSFSIILNGPAPDYPFTVPYVLDDSTSLPTDQHSLQAGSVTFASGQTVATVPVSLGADTAPSGNQTLVVRLDDQTTNEQDLAGGYDSAAPDNHDINAGSKSSHVITVTAGNVAPQVDLSLQQNGQQTMLVTPSGGSVTVSATVRDLNATDTHTFDWSGTSAEVVDTDESLTDAALVFEPNGLAEGVYPVQVTVTDSQGAAAVRTLYFRLVANLPELAASADTDGDGISDQEEGVADSDDDGIVDYLDNLSASNLLPEALATTAAFVLECEPGVLCRLGQYALQNGTSGSRLLASEVASLPSMRQDSSFTPVGGIFDFEIADLPAAGQSVSVVIPLGEVIPVNAVYRKFQNGQWRTFAEDDNNQLHSAPGSLGYCPPPGDTQWTAGLTAGDYCVQLTLEDGGPNDADGVVNASIADPGAVSVSTADDSDHDGGGSFGGAGLLALWALQRYRRCERAKLRH